MRIRLNVGSMDVPTFLSAPRTNILRRYDGCPMGELVAFGLQGAKSCSTANTFAAIRSAALVVVPHTRKHRKGYTFLLYIFLVYRQTIYMLTENANSSGQLSLVGFTSAFHDVVLVKITPKRLNWSKFNTVATAKHRGRIYDVISLRSQSYLAIHF